jgi:hypothetical protein
MSTTVDAGDAVQSLVSGYESTLSSVSIKAVGSQIVLMSILSVSFKPLRSARANTSQLGTLMAFSVLRPRDKRVYAPKVGLHSLGRVTSADIHRSNTFKRQRNRIQRSIFNLHQKSRTVYLVGSVRFCIRQRKPCCSRSVSGDSIERIRRAQRFRSRRRYLSSMLAAVENALLGHIHSRRRRPPVRASDISTPRPDSFSAAQSTSSTTLKKSQPTPEITSVS